MSFYIPTRDLDDWRKLLGDPERHWKTGRSAKSCAETWFTADGFPDEVREALNGSNIELLKDLEFLMGFPEFQVKLPPSGHASQNDLWVIARSLKKNELVSIAVECKVDESFGPIVGEWIEEEPSGKAKRLDYLCKKLGLKRDEVQNTRYQLLHRSVSALEMAEKLCCKNALVMINSFDKKRTGFSDYAKYCQLLGCDPEVNKIGKTERPSGINLFLVWVQLDCVPDK